MVVHLTTPVEAYGIYPGGQNGNPGSPFYDNMAMDWAKGQYYRLWIMKKDEKADKRIKGSMKFSS
jgi:penicillin amidase